MIYKHNHVSDFDITLDYTTGMHPCLEQLFIKEQHAERDAPSRTLPNARPNSAAPAKTRASPLLSVACRLRELPRCSRVRVWGKFPPHLRKDRWKLWISLLDPAGTERRSPLGCTRPRKRLPACIEMLVRIFAERASGQRGDHSCAFSPRLCG